jgi:hypothetical protein
MRDPYLSMEVYSPERREFLRLEAEFRLALRRRERAAVIVGTALGCAIMTLVVILMSLAGCVHP